MELPRSVTFSQKKDSGFKITEIRLKINNLHPDLENYHAVQLSDLHLGVYTSSELIDQAIDIASRLAPDIFLLTGDYVHVGRKELREILFKAFGPEATRFRHYRRLARFAAIELSEKLEKLEAPDGLIGIWGNHDYLEGIRTLKKYLPEKITWLKNESIILTKGNARLVISGIDDYRLGKPDIIETLSDFIEMDIKGSNTGTNTGAYRSDELTETTPRILLSHNPDSVLLPDAEHLKKFSIMLCGHTHGGQVCLPGSIPIKSETEQRKYRRSLCHFDSLPVYISNGIGCSGVPLRLFCPPEIVSIRLTRG